MSATRRKRKAAKKNIPPIYSYPQYGYTQPQPVQPDSQQVQPESEYVYYPADQYGNIIGPPVNYPPIDNRNYQEPYPYSNYPSNIPTYGSYVDTPRRNRRYYDNYYYNYPRPDYPYNNRGESRHESLPPIRYQVFHLFFYLSST